MTRNDRKQVPFRFPDVLWLSSRVVGESAMEGRIRLVPHERAQLRRLKWLKQ